MLECVITGMALLCASISASADNRPVLTGHFLVDLHEGGEQEAKQLAKEYGFGGARKVIMSSSFT